MHINKLFNLSGKIAIVTGGAGLFGKPISLALAEAGAHVIIASRNAVKSQKFADDLTDNNMKAEGLRLDLSDENSIKNGIDNIYNKYNHIDILVNNAVTREGLYDLEYVTKEDWEHAQKVNSTGLMLITQAVIKYMREKKSGSIINISSIQGAVGPNFTVYGKTKRSSPVNYTYDKWGMVGFTKWVANKYGKFNIRSNCISPGGYGPELKKTTGEDEFYKNYIRLTPLGRFANDDDIKGPIVFLASDAASYITGHNLLVDGGWTSW